MPKKYYKILRADGISPTKEFDYSPYLPKGESPGEWLPIIADARPAKDAYYVSEYWNFWYEDGARIYEVEIEGEGQSGERGAPKQACCARIRLVRDVTETLIKVPHDKNFNIGEKNSGLRNIGSFNTGEFNIGKRNTGKLNIGDFNTGDSNEGTDNVGNCNLGSSNSGDGNIGHSNAGSHNKGSYNTGSHNTGNANTGSFNTGHRNSGKWNIGSFHTGHFNTIDAPSMMFNRKCAIPIREIKIPLWLNKPNPKESFEKASAKELRDTIALPNFDFSIFEKITGISESDFKRRLNDSLQ